MLTKEELLIKCKSALYNFGQMHLTFANQSKEMADALDQNPGLLNLNEIIHFLSILVALRETSNDCSNTQEMDSVIKELFSHVDEQIKFKAHIMQSLGVTPEYMQNYVESKKKLNIEKNEKIFVQGPIFFRTHWPSNTSNPNNLPLSSVKKLFQQQVNATSEIDKAYSESDSFSPKASK